MAQFDELKPRDTPRLRSSKSGYTAGLAKEVYTDLAAVVGEKYISDEAFVVACHDWFGIGSNPSKPDSLVGNPPAAVVLPANTEQVAAIVRVCNRHKLAFKAHSTGYGNYSGVGTKGSISIDLRRMNKIEIDAESRMAIIEPYVTAGRLMAEAFKHRLMTHVVGAGAVHSPLASATSFAGMGVMGNHCSANVRNLLSLEWVTPEGEIVRIGSNGSGAGWFTGEGPGPGFRGMIRGEVGALGGLGVFTKIGYKLYPWAGPEKVESTGQHPQHGLKLPENFATYQLVWDDWSKGAEATRTMLDNACVTFISRTPPAGVGNMLTRTNREYYDALKSGTLSRLATKDCAVGWTVTIMAWSKDEFEWKESALQEILHITGGRKMPMTEEEREVLTANSVLGLYVPRFIRMAEGGAAGVSLGIYNSVDMLPKVIERAKVDIGDQQKPGGDFMEADTEQSWMWLNEGRTLWAENNPTTSRFRKGGLASVVFFVLDNFIRNEKKPVGASFFAYELMELFSAKMGGVDKWMRKTKNIWDPHNLSDSKSYVQPSAVPAAKAGPFVKHVLFSPILRPVMKWLVRMGVK